MQNEKNKKNRFYTNSNQNNEKQGRDFQKRDNKNTQENRGNSNYNKNDEKNSKIREIMEEIRKNGYRNNNIIRKELVSDYAKEIAKEIKNDNSKLSNSQLRAFFNEINRLRQKYIRDDKEENEKSLQNLAIELLILKSKLEYKRGKSGNDKLPEKFYIFMKENIDYVVEKDKIEYFKDFKIFFETVVGYTYGLGGVDKK